MDDPEKNKRTSKTPKKGSHKSMRSGEGEESKESDTKCVNNEGDLNTIIIIKQLSLNRRFKANTNNVRNNF